MDENMNMEPEATQGAKLGNESEVQDGPKAFTQDEVNRIIQGRLDQMKKQAAKEQEAEYARKIRELQAREMQILVRERLDARSMPRQLADIITCTDEKELDGKLNAIEGIYGKKADKPQGFTIKGGRPAEGNTRGGIPSMGDPVRRAMGLE